MTVLSIHLVTTATSLICFCDTAVSTSHVKKAAKSTVLSTLIFDFTMGEETRCSAFNCKICSMSQNQKLHFQPLLFFPPTSFCVHVALSSAKASTITQIPSTFFLQSSSNSYHPQYPLKDCQTRFSKSKVKRKLVSLETLQANMKGNNIGC